MVSWHIREGDRVAHVAWCHDHNRERPYRRERAAEAGARAANVMRELDDPQWVAEECSCEGVCRHE